jgi:hypothetical protein
MLLFHDYLRWRCPYWTLGWIYGSPPSYKKKPYTRDNFVEFEPQTTVKGFEIDLKECGPEWLLNKVLRIERPEDRLHQRLGIHHRCRIAWWSSKTIDELFEGGRETIMMQGEFTIPLELTPEDYAEFTIVERGLVFHVKGHRIHNFSTALVFVLSSLRYSAQEVLLPRDHSLSLPISATSR